MNKEAITARQHAVLGAAQARRLSESKPAPVAVQPSAMPTLTLGKIGARLGFNLSAEFMQKLGFEAKREKGAVLFHESDWTAIFAALIAHIVSVSKTQKQAA